MSLTLCIDFDGTLVEDGITPLSYRPGALAALRILKGAGHRLILHSCRCNPIDPAPVVDAEIQKFYTDGQAALRVTDQWELFVSMRAFLKGTGVWDLFDDVWQSPGKPLADIYIDDRYEAPKWAELAQQFGQGAMR